MAKFLISTTGTLSPVIFFDIGARTFYHPTVDYDLSSEFTIDEISNSNDINSSITGGTITVKDESGNFINSSKDLVVTVISGGTNIYTAGTYSNVAVHMKDDIVLNSVRSLNLSATTLYSGSTNLANIFMTSAGAQTYVQNGVNTFTGGTPELPTVNLTSATLSNLTVSGNSNHSILSATTLSAGTIYSGSTDIGNFFGSLNAQLLTKANLSGATFTGPIFATSFSSTTFSAGTIYSGSTDIGNIFAYPSQLTKVQNGLNTYTGGTATLPSVNISSATLSNLSVSGSSTHNSISATTISGGTLYSGSTELASIFAIIPQLTRVQNGINTFTGGTEIFPTVNITGASLDNIFVSGNSRFNSLSSATISATTIIATTITAVTITATTLFSGSSNLTSSIINIAKDSSIKAYAIISMNNNVAASVATVGIPTKISGTTTQGIVNFMTMSGNNMIVYTGSTPQIFNVIINISAIAAASNQNLQFFVRKNNVTDNSSIMQTQFGTADQALSLGTLISMIPGDYLELWAVNNTANKDITVKYMTFVVTQV